MPRPSSTNGRRTTRVQPPRRHATRSDRVSRSIQSSSSGVSSFSSTPSTRKRFLAPLLILIAIVFVLSRCSSNDEPAQEDTSLADTSMIEQADDRVTFVAVGDNLPDASIGAYADSLAGGMGDGAYDYAPLYEDVKPMIEAADLAYVKEETHLGGNQIGPHSWPSFNTTDEMGQALVDTGFDLVASASNHSYDWGAYGALEHSREVWDSLPVVFTGTAATRAQAEELALIERKGITFALLDYTYGVNGFTESDLPSYAVNFISEDRIRRDVARAKEAADVVMVAMHWGTEKLLEADADQKKYAQLLADLEVDVVLGSHPHVIGPLEWIEGKNGNRTLVAYSLGNFISHHETPRLITDLEGALSLSFVKAEDGSVSIQDVVWTPLVNHIEDSYHRVIPLKDYTDELASKHRLFSTMDDPIGQLRELNRSVISNEFAIDDGQTDT